MKTRPKKNKKYSYIKDCKKQPKKICDQDEMKSIQPLGDTQESSQSDVQRYCKKFSNVFPFPVRKQNCHSELKKIYKLEMKTCTKKTKKHIPSGVDKSCYNNSRQTQGEVRKTDAQRKCGKFSNVFTFSAKEQNHHFELKKIHELEMETRPKKTKK